MKLLLIVGTFRLPPSRLDEARPVMEAMIQASRNETGCLEYSYSEDVLDRGLIHVHECWSDQAALDRHFASAQMAAWRGQWPRLGIGERNLVAFEVADGFTL